MGMYGFHHLICRMWASDCQYFWMRFFHHIALGTQAASNNNFSILGQRLADCFKRFCHRTVDETASVNYHQIGIRIVWRNNVTLSAQASKDMLGIHRRLRTTERYEADAWRCVLFAHVLTLYIGLNIFFLAANFLRCAFNNYTKSVMR